MKFEIPKFESRTPWSFQDALPPADWVGGWDHLDSYLRPKVLTKLASRDKCVI